ncbi:hypothetical protein [Dictyobacter formicarum]|uniref:DUF1269 domain-containing protein n=1 Tax=Dictyobacter formicarum TaxID=2778368 RepID=A0ABQ3VTX1_9CHLR|nr:hypothetical protein [Dictyobacter formicarum]GHO88751.1 hypothetical protein KSZ_67570 [Dictyobacter formicarum]
MAEAEQTVIVGVFEDREAVIHAMDALIKAGFKEDQLGFVARTSEEHVAQAKHHVQHGHSPKAIARGIIGGIIGAADILLVPFIGPADASNVLATALPITEEALDNLPYPGSKEHRGPVQRPDDAFRTDKPVSGLQGDVAPIPQQEATPVEETEEQAHKRSEQRTSIVTGGVVGGALGAAAAALFLPGIGPIVAGGIVAAALGGGAVGSVAGSFLGTLTDMGIPKEHARQYAQDVKEGRTVVTVKDTERAQEVSEILRQQGAQDVQIH